MLLALSQAQHNGQAWPTLGLNNAQNENAPLFALHNAVNKDAASWKENTLACTNTVGQEVSKSPGKGQGWLFRLPHGTTWRKR